MFNSLLTLSLGLTVGLLVGGALLAGANSNPPDEFSKVKEGDHSWRDILGKSQLSS